MDQTQKNQESKKTPVIELMGKRYECADTFKHHLEAYIEAMVKAEYLTPIEAKK